MDTGGCGERASRAATSTWRGGFHGGEQELAGQAHALDPQPRLCAPNVQPARHACGRKSPGLQRRPRRARRGGCAQGLPGPSVPAPEPARLPPSSALPPQPAGAAGHAPGRNMHGPSFICILPPSARGSSPGCAHIFGHGLLGSADAVCWRSSHSGRSRASWSARRTGSGSRARTFPRSPGSRATSQASRGCPIGPAGGSSTSCSSAG